MGSSARPAATHDATGLRTADPGPGSVQDPGGPQPSPVSVKDRGTAFAAGPPKMPRRIISIAVAVILAVGIGGSLLDRLARSSTPAPRSPTRATASLPSTPEPPQNATQLHAPLPAFLGLKALHGPAPAFSLTDAVSGGTVSLSSLRGHVVVLTFANAACDDICPVLATELTQADALLGPTTVPVTFVTVNSDPLATTAAPTAPIITRTALGGLANWRFLTGAVRRLNPVWVHYGISITADRATGVVVHDNALYFIRPDGSLAWSATPFADEAADRTFSLSPAEKTRFAQGIAHYADQLASSS